MRRHVTPWALPCLVAAALAAPASGQTLLPSGPPDGWTIAEADVCAVAAIAEPPSRSRGGTDKGGKRVETIHDSATWYMLAWSYDAGRTHGWWGSCRTSVPHALFFSADRRFALAQYAMSAASIAMLSGEEGFCVYEKAAGRWQLVGCKLTALS